MIKINTNNNQKGLFLVDSRTFLFLLLIINLGIFFTPSVLGELLLIGFAVFVALLCGAVSAAIKFCIVYLILIILEYGLGLQPSNLLFLTISLGCRYMRKVFPCGLIGITLIKSKSISQFMASLTKMNIPKSILIPLTILMRYLPAIAEDYNSIKCSIKMRNLSHSLFRHPILTVECIYVPLLLSASRRAEELTTAAITRGIENPKQRTSLVVVKLRIIDYMLMICGMLVVFFSIKGF